MQIFRQLPMNWDMSWEWNMTLKAKIHMYIESMKKKPKTAED